MSRSTRNSTLNLREAIRQVRDLPDPEPCTSLRELPSLARLLHFTEGELARTPEGLMSVAIDVTDLEDQYIVCAELPGVRRDEISILCHERLLSIRGEKRAECGEIRGRVRERRYGSFERSLQLPDDADIDQIRATLDDGVLRVEIAKRVEDPIENDVEPIRWLN